MMNVRRFMRGIACAAVFFLATTLAAPAAPTSMSMAIPATGLTAPGLVGSIIPPPVNLNLYCPGSLIKQNFTQTTWWICWHEVAGNDSIANPNGLAIGPVYFQKSPGAPIVRILWDMRVSDYFVPYESGSPRFYDLSGFNFTLTTVTAADCPAAVGGTLLSAHVCQEVRDRGLMWKDGGGVRRGQEIVLWGALYAGNYRYIQEYTFRDDGFIIGRLGATGQNYPPTPLQPHTHNALWRIDIDLNGTINEAHHFQHLENPGNPAGTSTDTLTPINTAQGLSWNPQTHDAIEVVNPTFKNAQNHLSAYDLVPLVTGGGLTRHTEPFTHEDFWVTPYNPLQFAAKNLVSYVAGSPPVFNRDLVLWYKGSLHHHPRDEDGVFNHSGQWVGTADVMWTGFMLMPHNYFDCSPFYQPCP